MVEWPHLTTFYLVRHGKKAEGLGDVPLSTAGRMQAQATAGYLQLRPIKGVYTSPLRRAKDTAAYIAACHRLEILEDARLRERANWGDWPGQTFAEFVAMWERCNRERAYIPPVGVSAQQAGERLAAFIHARYQQHPHDELVAVAHGGVIADFLLNVFPAEQLAQVNPAFVDQPYQSSVMSECSITVVRFDGERYALEALGSVAH